MFREMIKRAVDYKQNPSDFMDEVMQELEVHFSEYQNSLITDVLVFSDAVSQRRKTVFYHAALTLRNPIIGLLF